MCLTLSSFSFSPSGKKFRSKPQLSRYLGNTVDLGCFDFRTGKMMPGKLQKNKQKFRHDPHSLAKVTLIDYICGGVVSCASRQSSIQQSVQTGMGQQLLDALHWARILDRSAQPFITEEWAWEAPPTLKIVSVMWYLAGLLYWLFFHHHGLFRF